MVGEYADKVTAVEAMISLMKLAQMKGESPKVRVEKLAALAFPEEVRENVTIQAHLPDLYNKKNRRTVTG